MGLSKLKTQRLAVLHLKVQALLLRALVLRLHKLVDRPRWTRLKVAVLLRSKVKTRTNLCSCL
jgi:hypothetical protein